MANQKLEYLYNRRPPLHYESPAFCINEFSSTAEPTITLTPFARRRGPTGLIIGGTGLVILSWDNYPGALCYSVYKAVDEEDPFGEYILVAECIQDAEIDLTPFGEGVYRISAITPEGETELSDPITFTFVTPPVTFSIFDTGLATATHKLGENGDVVGVDTTLATPALFRGGKLIRLLTLGGSTGHAVDVNSNGVIVGQSQITGDLGLRVTRWVVTNSSPLAVGFVQPGVGATEVVTIDTADLSVNDGVWIDGGGTYRVEAIGSGTLTLRNLYAANAPVTTPIPAGAVAKKIVITDISGATSNNPFINEAGHIAFQSTISTDVSIFTPPATVTHIGKAGAGSSELIAGINNNDELALAVFIPPTLTTFGYRWNSGAFIDITPVAAAPTLAVAIAPNNPYIVGEATFNFEPNARGFYSLGGQGIDIGALGGSFSTLRAINDSGVAVGHAADGSEVPHAIRYFGGISDIGSAFFSDSDAWDINNAGYVIGTATIAAVLSATVWSPTNVPTNLNDFPLTGTTYTVLNEGRQINAAKQVTAHGIHAVGPDTIALVQLPPEI